MVSIFEFVNIIQERIASKNIGKARIYLIRMVAMQSQSGNISTIVVTYRLDENRTRF